MLDMTAIDNNITEAGRVLGDQAGISLDGVVREILNAGTNVQYGDGSKTSRSAITDTDVMTVAAVKRAVTTLKRMNAKKINGDYVAIIHPDVAYDLMNDPKWEAVATYNPKNLYAGEIGRLYGVRFVETSEAKIFEKAGTSSIDVYSTLFLGADAYGTTSIDGGGLEMIVKPKGSAGSAVFISGGTNSGKTTFLNALSAYIPADERVITIEDSAELQIQQVKNLVRLETRTANSQGEGAIGIGDLIKASLRMNPSRIIVGEVRGKEALELLNSYNTGHDGGMSSGHGNSPKDMLARLETMVLMGAELPLAAIRSQIASALDVMIHLGRERNKKRRVFWIVEVDGYEEGQIRLHTLYELGEQGLEKKGELKNTRKLWMAGEEI